MNVIKTLIICALGSMIFAIGVNSFLIPNNLGEGGVTGITFILYYLYETPTWITSLMMNAVLLIIGYKFLSKKTAVYTLMTVMFMSLSLALTEDLGTFSDDLMVSAIAGGITSGIGLGMIIMYATCLLRMNQVR